MCQKVTNTQAWDRTDAGFEISFKKSASQMFRNKLFIAEKQPLAIKNLDLRLLLNMYEKT